MAKFLNLLRLRNFSTAADTAVEVSATTDTEARLKIDAGGKHVWGSGSASGDTNLYRSAADTLKTDDAFVAAGGLTVKTIEIDPAGATTGNALVFDGTKFAPGAGGGGGASVTVSDTAPSSPSAGDLWFESDTGQTYVYYDSYWVEIGGGSGGGAVVTSTTLSTNSATTISGFVKTVSRSGEFTIQVTQGSKYTVSKILVIHDDATPTLTEYGVIELGASRIPLTLSTAISGSNVLIQATVTDAATTSAVVKVTSTLIPV